MFRSIIRKILNTLDTFYEFIKLFDIYTEEMCSSPSNQGIQKLEFCINQSIIVSVNDAN